MLSEACNEGGGFRMPRVSCWVSMAPASDTVWWWLVDCHSAMNNYQYVYFSTDCTPFSENGWICLVFVFSEVLAYGWILSGGCYCGWYVIRRLTCGCCVCAYLLVLDSNLPVIAAVFLAEKNVHLGFCKGSLEIGHACKCTYLCDGGRRCSVL